MAKFRVWHIPQVPGKPFHVEIPDLVTAKIVIVALADYDLFQLRNRIKPDYANVSGLEVFDPDNEDDLWVEWCDEETGESIWDQIRSEHKP